MIGSDVPAPLTDELRAKEAPLPAPATREPERKPADTAGSASGEKKTLTGAAGEVKMPK